jgi:hypothetical protein
MVDILKISIQSTQETLVVLDLVNPADLLLAVALILMLEADLERAQAQLQEIALII